MKRNNSAFVYAIAVLIAARLSTQQSHLASLVLAAEPAKNAARAPQTISKSEVTGEVAATGKSRASANEGSADNNAAPAEGSREPTIGKRDPFRPLTVKVRPNVTVRRRENLSPLERFELGQLKLVGVIWQIQNPTALVEDSTGLGYVVKIGTPIGANEGKIKLILKDSLLIEEEYIDIQGAKKKREVSMRLNGDS